MPYSSNLPKHATHLKALEAGVPTQGWCLIQIGCVMSLEWFLGK